MMRRWVSTPSITTMRQYEFQEEIPVEKMVLSVCLFKQGEFIRNWRSRHFLLFEDGSFIGYNKSPLAITPCDCKNSPKKPARRLSHFSVKACALRVMGSCEGKYEFSLEDLFHVENNTHVTRHFYATSKSTRTRLAEEIRKLAEAQSSRPTDGMSNVKRNRIQEDQYIKLGLAGRGAYGSVYIAEEIATKRIVALKILEKQLLRKKDFKLKHVLNESFVARSVDHAFIAKQYGAGQTPEVFMFVMEFLPGGDLFSYLYSEKHRQNNPFFIPEKLEPCTRMVAAMLASALKYLHSKRIAYRDMKLENLMLDEFGYVKIIDFGISKEIYEGQRAATFCGTAQYIAPEIIMSEVNGGDDDSGYGLEVDWWTLGILVYELVYKTTPFQTRGNGSAESEQTALFKRILKAQPNVKNRFNTRVNRGEQRVFMIGSKLLDFVSGLLHKDPEKRLGDMTILDHEFLREIDMDKLKRREYKSYIEVKPFSKERLSDFVMKDKRGVGKMGAEVESSVMEANLAGFSYAQPDFIGEL